jgi:hypothetical protein
VLHQWNATGIFGVTTLHRSDITAASPRGGTTETSDVAGRALFTHPSGLSSAHSGHEQRSDSSQVMWTFFPANSSHDGHQQDGAAMCCHCYHCSHPDYHCFHLT